MIRKAILLATMVLAGCGSDEPAVPVAELPPTTTEPPVPEPPAPEPPAPEPPAPEPTGPVVFIGDSITASWSFPPDRDWVNAGASGQWSQLMLARFFDDVLSLSPSVVHILAGTNDVRVYLDPSLDAVIEMAESAAASGACVIIGTIPPNIIWGVHPEVDSVRGDENIENWNTAIRDLAAERGYLLADYHPALSLPDGSLDWEYSYDGIHPNARGHERMLEIVEPLVDECSSRR